LLGACVGVGCFLLGTGQDGPGGQVRLGQGGDLLQARLPLVAARRRRQSSITVASGDGLLCSRAIWSVQAAASRPNISSKATS